MLRLYLGVVARALHHAGCWPPSVPFLIDCSQLRRFPKLIKPASDGSSRAPFPRRGRHLRRTRAWRGHHLRHPRRPTPADKSAHPASDRARPLNSRRASSVDRVHRLGHQINHDIRGRPARPACLRSEGVADLVDGNGKGSTTSQRQRTQENPHRRPPALLRPWTECGRSEDVTNVNSKNQ